MGVTTEPPWLHKTVGVAPKNATASHTITFSSFGDAPFTPADGSLLTLWVHGAVTNTITGQGWTKQAGPVATGELSLFTKVCAGDTAVTITHNASNYAVAVALVEYPSGSTITGVDSTTGSNDTAEPLTGLPGTEQLIVAGLGRVPVGSETGASIAPSAPYVEVADQFIAAGGGTDGAYLAVWHRINYTGTSITPTVTPTYSGTWSNGSREKISLAINAVAPPAGTTPFTKDWDTTWRITNAFTKDYATTWRVSTAWVKDWADTWRVSNAWTKDWSSTWRILNAWQKDWLSTWVIRNAFTKDWSDSWRVRNAWQKDYADSYNVLSGTAFTKDWADTWRITTAWSADYSDTWRVRNAWQKDYATAWDILEDTSWFKEWSSTWRIRSGFLKDYVTTWRILSDIPTPSLPADATVHLEDHVTAFLADEMVTVRLP